MIGKLLGGRYQIEEKIGEGGMAKVYRSRDILLNRVVTVKILKEQFAGDQEFIRRFRREAQAAACLSHPHIVNIFDVGEEQDIYYIVMEYVEGKTLKDLIREKGRLPVSEAVELTRQISEALIHAHAARVIHRDIKPQNIIISRRGQAKVTDFGIAQAVDSATVTFGERVMGSVHYFSPEQARGTFTGEQSDIYSLGIVFYEMLSGHVPYDGVSPISIALKHLQEEITLPEDVFKDIPEPLANVLLKAVQKSPARRYGSAIEFHDDLRLWQREGRVNSAREGEHNQMSGSITNMNHLKENRKNRPKFWKTGWFIAVVAAVVLVAIGISGYLAFRSFLFVPDVTVPEVEGVKLEEAVDILENEGLAHKVNQIFHDTVPSGHVVSQDPRAGRVVKKGREVNLAISQGRETVEIPDVVGLTELEARILLGKSGLTVEVIKENNEEIPVDEVIRQNPRPGFSLPKGEEVVIYVSSGGRPFPIANLEGMTGEQFDDYLSRTGLVLNRERSEFSERPAGTIIEQFPAAGTMVRTGELVDIVWSKGMPEEPGDDSPGGDEDDS